MKLRFLTGMLVVLLVDSATVRGGMVPDMLVASQGTDQILRYDGDTGDFVGVFAEGNGLAFPDHMVFGPDQNLYVGGAGGKILRFDGQTGDFIDVFTSGLAANSAGMQFGPNGDLYIARIPSLLGGAGVVRIDGETGQNLGYFISFPGSNFAPTDLDFGSDGNLYLALNGQVLRYDAETAELIDTFLPSLQSQIIGFESDGYFYGSVLTADVAWQYDAESAELLNTYFAPELDGAGGFTVGPDGSLYLSSLVSDAIVRFDTQSAEFIDTFAVGGGLDVPRDVLFVPEPTTGAWLLVAILLIGRGR